MPTITNIDNGGQTAAAATVQTAKRLFRVTIATALPPAFGATFDDFTIEAGSAEVARAQFRLGPWQVISDVVAVDDLPARIAAEKAGAARVFALPANVARRAADAARLEKQRATSRAANARRAGTLATAQPMKKTTTTQAGGRDVLWQAINAATKLGAIESIHYDRANFIRRARAAFKRALAEPGDCAGDLPLLAGLAVAEAQVGRGAGWIPEVQRIGCIIAEKISPSQIQG